MSTGTGSVVLLDECDFEIVGLEESTNGRLCCTHECCGKAVVPGSLIRIRLFRVNGT